ncbi:MAG: 4-hydroxythreonine-4-phosphate dehydrogenase, partial [Deltaproteobacteria bacterium]|nr:4-hydroxythreonine-4-phosphate dehydrogenase [Deltaproteobacteria bacterium]
MSNTPLIGITMGDPAGIGPEIIAKALADKAIYDFCRPVVLGDPAVLSSALPMVSQDMALNIIVNPSEAESAPGRIDLVAVSDLKSERVRPGKPTKAGGKAMVEYIFRAVEMIQMGELEAMVTCPI